MILVSEYIQIMRGFQFRNDPVFQYVVRKYTRYFPFVGCLGTVCGILVAFRELDAKAPRSIVAPGIIEALLATAIGVTAFFLVMLIHYCYWLIKRK